MRGGGGGMRGGGGRLGGGFSGGSGRIGGGGGRPAGVRAPAPRVAAPRPRMAPRGRGVSFGMGMATGMMMGRRRSMWGWGGGWGWGRRRRMMVGGPMHHGGGGGCGCFSMILFVFIMVIGIAIIGQVANLGSGSFGNFGGGQVTQSTIAREALPRGTADSSVPFIVDDTAFIANRSMAENGLRSFYNATGVRPTVYIVNNINGAGPRNVTLPVMQDYARARYTDLIGTNQAHVLFLFITDGNFYSMFVQPGSAAATVIDDQAQDILMDFVERYWAIESNNSRMFSRAFESTGDRIMSVHRSPWINVLIVAGVLLILFLLFTWWKAKRDQKNLEAEQTEAILNADLTEFGSSTHDEASRLAQQYQNQDDDQNPYR